ncbi:hypothetical protein D3C75_738230 [compost metagenome]
MGGLKRFVEPLLTPGKLVQLGPGFLIKPLKCIGPVLNGAPVGHDPALIRPALFQHIIQQMFITTGIFAVYLVVGTHDRSGLGQFYRHLESQKIRLSMFSRIDHGIEPMPVGFVAIQ